MCWIARGTQIDAKTKDENPEVKLIAVFIATLMDERLNGSPGGEEQ